MIELVHLYSEEENGGLSARIWNDECCYICNENKAGLSIAGGGESVSICQDCINKGFAALNDT